MLKSTHNLPVGAPGSADHLRNGIALSPTFHRAYDARLIYLDETYQMTLNPKVQAELRALGLDAGVADLRASLGGIHLPADKRQWPDPAFIAKANRYGLIERP